MSARLESPLLDRRRPFSQLQNIPSPTLSNSILNVSYESSNKSKSLKSSLFAVTHSKVPNHSDDSYNFRPDYNNLRSPLTTRLRSKPFIRRQRRESVSSINVSYCSSNVDQIASPSVRSRPFAHILEKENLNSFEDISYLSSNAENASGSEISAVNVSLPKLFKKRKSQRNKKRSNDSSFIKQPNSDELLDNSSFNVSYCSSSVESKKSIGHVASPSVRSRPFTRSLGKDNLNCFDDISYLSSNAENASESEISLVDASLPKLFKNKKCQRNKARPNQSSFCEQPNSNEFRDNISSPANSSIKDVPFKVPKPFKQRRIDEDECMFDISYKSSEDGSTHDIELSHSKKRKKFFKGKPPLSSFINNLTYMSSESEVSSQLTGESLESANESDATESEDLRRASMATREDCLSELDISKLTNQSKATSLNLTAEGKGEEIQYFLTEQNLEPDKEKMNRTDELYVTNLGNDSSFLLTPRKRSKISTTSCVSHHKEIDPSNAGDNAEAIAFQERQKPFCRRLEIPESTIPDVSYDSSKLEINESNVKRNHRLFANNRSGENVLVSNITYNSSVESNNVSSSTLPQHVSASETKLNSSRSSAAIKVNFKNNSIQGDSYIIEKENIKNDSNVIHLDKTDKTEETSKANSTLVNDESNPFLKSRPFNKLQNKLESSFPCTSYVQSQETPISKIKPPAVKKLFNRNSGLPDVSFSITYEESVENNHENTSKLLSSSTSSEESVASPDESSEEEDKSDETSGSSDSEKMSESRLIEEDPKKICADNESKEIRATEEEIVDKNLEMSGVNDIDSHTDIVEEQHLSHNDIGVSSSFSIVGTINPSISSQAHSELFRDTSLSDAEGTYMTSQNNITVLTERAKQPKDSFDCDEFRKVIDAKIACIRKEALEKVANKHKMLHYQESPRKKEKKHPEKDVAITKKYPKPKLYKPARWANKRLYDYLGKCLEYYGLNRMLEAEAVVKMIHETIQIVTHNTTYEKNSIHRLKVELASRKIIVTTYDFYVFVRNFLPYSFEEKVIPCVQPYTNVVWPPKDEIKESEPIII